MNADKRHTGPLAPPAHVAIIMDGNGRWAQKRGLDRSAGHVEGVNTVRRITEAASKAGVSYLTLYAFSTENWNRPQQDAPDRARHREGDSGSDPEQCAADHDRRFHPHADGGA